MVDIACQGAPQHINNKQMNAIQILGPHKKDSVLKYPVFKGLFYWVIKVNFEKNVL